MPEGLDQASDVFRAELNPHSDRPRDDSGRFAAVTRPETMFEPRPIEGDPLTGDTRDGGEDARLAAAERRIADGRAEEGDDRRPVSDGARARNARADDGYERTEAQSQRGRSQELQTQDADRPDGSSQAEAERGDADGSSEPDAEAAKWQVSYDGKPVQELEVVVDGQTVSVTLDECIRGYIRKATFNKRMTQLDLARQFIEQEAAQNAQARQYYIQKLQYADRLIAELTPPQPDWDQEFAQNPFAAHQKQKAYAEIYNKQAFLQAEVQRTAQESAQDYEQRLARYANEQKAQFIAEANLRDNNAYNAATNLMCNYAKMRDFGDGEIATVFDKRMLHVLYDAAKYNQAVTAQPKPVISGSGKTLTPGVATPIGTATRRSLDDAMRKLAKTGRTDDAAIVFQRLIR